MSILVTGGTGTIGAETLRILGQKNVSGVRALVRDAEKATSVAAQGMELAVGTFEDRRAMAAALSGIKTVVLITPASQLAEKQAQNTINAAKSAGVRRIVRISAIKADPDGPTNNTCAHGRTEVEITRSGMSYVFLRPNLFMQNMFMSAEDIKMQSSFSFAMGTGKMGMIDTRDIAACAAECALSDQWDHRTFELTGPKAISYADVATVLSDLTEKSIEYIPVAPDKMYASIVRAGWGEWMAALARDYGQAYASGWGDFTTDNVERITQKPPRTFRDFASEVFIPALK